VISLLIPLCANPSTARVYDIVQSPAAAVDVWRKQSVAAFKGHESQLSSLGQIVIEPLAEAEILQPTKTISADSLGYALTVPVHVTIAHGLAVIDHIYEIPAIKV
jgi:hypothetical protein